ncbi:MAG TPA: hypothetical protein VFA59_15385 [Vicinamibacterales bacterium]|nr:hypothetical protein [Vicinamibacterales bacterium]
MDRTRQIGIGITAMALALTAGATRAGAQTAETPTKWEIFGGYLHGRDVYTARQDNVSFGGVTQPVPLCTADADANFGANFEQLLCDRNAFHGADVAVVYSISRYIGVATNVTWQRHSDTYVDNFGPGGVQTSTNTEHKYSVLGGVQIKDRASAAPVRPFAHALVGVVHEKLSGADANPVEGPSTYSDAPTSVGMKVGGGLDVRLGRNVDLRAIEIDYAPVFARDRDLSINPPDYGIHIVGKRADDVSLSFGIVLRR